MIRRRRDAGATNDAGTTLERIEMTTHVGTHIDALGHASIGGRLYNDLRTADVLLFRSRTSEFCASSSQVSEFLTLAGTSRGRRRRVPRNRLKTSEKFLQA